MALAFLCSCAGDVQEPPLNANLSPEDLQVFDTGKADGNIFNPDRLIEDHVFLDQFFLSLADVKAFLSWTPYNRPSFLAHFEEDGMSAAEIIVDAAQSYEINPLVLLVKLQVESSLIGRSEPPTNYLLQRSMGCGCHDHNPGCHGAPKGFREQIICAASLFREFMESLETHGQTWTGWGVGTPKMAEDNLWIEAETNATAALYTYTPWVLEGQGGNWLFWNVYRKYAHYILKTRPNHRWIGGLCESDEGCAFEEGVCNQSVPQESSVHEAPVTGFCTSKCEQFCPDSYSAYNAYTFCVDLGSHLPDGEAAGWCISKCDDMIFPNNNGCMDGFECVTKERFNDPDFAAKVCMPILPEESEPNEEEPPSEDPNPHG
jgi:hypothetical protein